MRSVNVRGRPLRWWTVVASLTTSAALFALAGCSEGDATVVGAQPPTTASIYPLLPTTTEPAAIQVVEEPSNAASFVVTPDGVTLPDPSVTPGSAFADVQAEHVCDPHYTQGVRQPRFNDKVEAFANYGISIRDRDVYQVDHLIPISLGGNNAPENLWPQPYEGLAGARHKDVLEQRLRELVCSQQLTLADAQAAIATNWWQAFQTYVGPASELGTLVPDDEPKPGEVVNGWPCEVEGAVGYTEPKHVQLTCQRNSYGELRWGKRY